MIMKRLKELREQKNLTQAQLSKFLNISASTIGMYEQGRRFPDENLLKHISQYFNVSIDYLLGLTNIPNTIDDYIQKSNTNSYHINDDEQTLIKKYRQLKAEDKQIIDTMLERFVPTKEPKSNEKAI